MARNINKRHAAVLVAFASAATLGQAAGAPKAPGATKAAHAPVESTAPIFKASSVSKGASWSEDPCTGSEHWNFSSQVSKSFIRGFETTLSRKHKPVTGFSEALALRRFAQTREAKTFGEYWISRALVDAGMNHVAFEGLANIASRPIETDTAGIQIAALGCMVQIHYKHPSMVLPASVTAQLSDYLKAASAQPDPSAEKPIVWGAVGAHFRAMLSEDRVPGDSLVALLKGAGAEESLTRGMHFIRKGEYRAAAPELEAFVNGSIPSHLKRFTDPAHLLLARAYYSSKRFEKSIAEFKQITKGSNELANSLSELSWAYLEGDLPKEAIGTAINLQAGGLRRTYAPEAPMVMSMALNELCQYPESIRAISVFRKNYEDPYRWLVGWNQSREKLYPIAVKFIQRKAKGVPERIAGEWIRSPLFLSTQDEINVLFDERDNSASVGKSGSSEERRMTADLLKFVRDFKVNLKLAKVRMRPGEGLPKSILTDLDRLRGELTHLKRLQMAAPVWKKVLVTHQKNVPVIEQKLIARINKDMESRTLRMKTQLEEIAENLQLVEVEIYNGASQDIIWQNAHPDYKKVAQQIQEEKQQSAGKTWDWGRSPASSGDQEEIWEDELGSFKANLYDNCTSKDRFLALKRLGH